MMKKFLAYLTNIQIIYHFKWMDPFYFCIFLTILWLVVLGWQLSLVYKNENPSKEASDWFYTPYGKCFLKVIFIPLLPFLAVIFIIGIPLSMSYLLVLKLVNKAHFRFRD
ncbi:hypothetical protein A8806_11718 [Faecalicatena orotica]|uniref:Uncharacterized protein n=1 Tax=Faecalicatena orotica TaxID=1544 RepID=A0A2Y9BJA9_9FIRM|nr:hypothetical protein A8806_11718 [Faecalicatena orotica]SSA58120.1 hypothetical protein SAMN05216536_11718 [Faecalicatena orotica]